MELRLPSYHPHSREDAEDVMEEDTDQRSPRDTAYNGTGDARWDDDAGFSSRQGPPGQAGMGTLSSGFQTTLEDEESMTATEAAKLRLFRALRTAKACDVSLSFFVSFRSFESGNLCRIPQR